MLLSSVMLCFPQKAWAAYTGETVFYKPENSEGSKGFFFAPNGALTDFYYFNTPTAAGKNIIIFPAPAPDEGKTFGDVAKPMNFFGVYTGMGLEEGDGKKFCLFHVDWEDNSDSKTSMKNRRFTVNLPEYGKDIYQLAGIVDVYDRNDTTNSIIDAEEKDYHVSGYYTCWLFYKDSGLNGGPVGVTPELIENTSKYFNPTGFFENINGNTFNLIDYSDKNNSLELKNVLGIYSAKKDVKVSNNTVNLFGGTVSDNNKNSYNSKYTRKEHGYLTDAIVAGVYMENGGVATNNSVNLIGKGVEYKDFLTPDEITTLGFTGDKARNKKAPVIDVPLCVVFDGDIDHTENQGNVLGIYGYGSTVSGKIHSESMDKMVFHISDALTFRNNPEDAENVMLTYTYTYTDTDDTENFVLPTGGVSVHVDSAPKGYKADGTLTLIHTTNSTIEGKISDVKVKENNIIRYDLEPYFNDDKTKLMLKASAMKEVDFSENGILLLETRAEDAAVVNNTTEFFLSQAMNQAEFAVMGTEKAKVIPFTALGGNLLKQKTGNYINTIGWNGVVGGAVKMNKTVLAAAAEYGRNKYDAYLSKDYVASGIVQTVGGALLASGNYDSGSHFDAVVHGGWLLSDYFDKEAGLKFNDSTAYLSVAGGYGYEIALSKADFLDIYGRGSYAITFGSTTNVMNADGGSNKVVFDAVNSVRLLADIGYKRHFRSGNELHVDSAYQFEFVGKASGAVYSNLIDESFSPDSPSLTGSTGMLKVGYNLNFSEYIALDTYITGWLGKQNGMTGGLSFMCHF